MPVSVGQIIISLGANTQAFSIEMDRAAALAGKSTGQIQGSLQKLSAGGFKQVSSEASAMGNKIAEAGAHGVTGVQATSAALRTLEGNMTNNLRAAERFLANTLKLGPALQGIFPVVGALALGGVLTELVEKAVKFYDAMKQLQAAPSRIADEFLKLNTALVTANDELAVSNDKVANEIARLSNKPENGLKLALDEARVSADRLGESLRKDLDEVAKLITQESVGKLKGFFTGNAPTSDIEKQLFGEDGYGGFKGKISDITDKYQQLLQASNSKTDAEALRAKERNELEQQYGTILASVTKQIAERQALQDKRGFLQQHPQLGDLTGQTRSNLDDIPADQGIALSLLKGLRRSLLAQANSVNLQTEGADLNATLAQKKTAGYTYTETPDVDPVAKKVSELRSQLVEVKTRLDEVNATPFARALAVGAADAQKTIAALNEELKPKKQTVSLGQSSNITNLSIQIETTKALTEETSRLSKEREKLFEEYETKTAAEASREAESLSGIRQQIDETTRLTAAQVQGAAAVRAAQLANIDSRVQAGQISQDEADLQKELLNTQNKLSDVEAAVKSTREDQLDTLKKQYTLLQQIGASQSTLKANEQEQQKLIDQQTLATGKFADGIKIAFREMSTGANSSAQDAYNFFNTTFDSINSSLVKLIEAQKVTWAGFFRGIAGDLAKIGLNKVESTLAGVFLGKGHGSSATKPTGAAGDPIYVKIAGGGGGGKWGTGGSGGDGGDDDTVPGDGIDDGSGTSAPGGGLSSIFGSVFSKIGGFFSSIFGKLFGAIRGGASSLFGSFGGFFADGGSVGAGQAYVVGEQGPELFMPRSSGSIVPNKALGGGASYYIDARGADEAAIDRRVRTALVQVHGSAVKSAAAVQADAARRRP